MSQVDTKETESAYQAGIPVCEEPEERNGLVCSKTYEVSVSET